MVDPLYEFSGMTLGIPHTDHRQAEGETHCAWTETVSETLTQRAREVVEQCVVELIDDLKEIPLKKVLPEYLLIIGIRIILHS